MMTSDEFFRHLLIQLGTRSPTIITFLVGLVLSSVYWSRRPRQSMLVMVASIIALVVSVGYALAFSYIVSDRGGLFARQTSLTVLGVITSILTAVPYILLFIAALGGRSEQSAFPVEMPPPPFARRS